MEALARVEADGTADEKRKVRAAVRKRYPNLPSGQADQNPDPPRATDRMDAAQRLDDRPYPAVVETARIARCGLRKPGVHSAQ
jgi:hypothetical protein